MTATLSASPDKIPDGGTTLICLAGGTPNSGVTITCKDLASGEKRQFTLETDGSGNGCSNFTAPTGWTEFTVSGGGAPSITVEVGQ